MSATSHETDRPLLDVRDLAVSYDVGGALRKRPLAVVQDVSFEIRPGETLGLVGGSGSGKSTTGRAILRLVEASGGSIDFDGVDVTAMGRTTPLSYRRDVQAVFQDPAASLNPRHTVGSAVTTALRRHGIGSKAERLDAAASAFERVGLARSHLSRFPNQMSGGQLQRVAIARALALKPRLVVCDEAVSALDLSTQGQIINLLADLQADTGVSYLFIAHDLGIVRHISDRIAVMHQGRIVEQGRAERIFDHPQHAYTRKLLAATPASTPHGRERRRARRLAHRGQQVDTAPSGV
ncbi:peptide/nickel transport system ATP-binding protein [Mumia flava]|uniref:Peptide/nickel transport system ATP-binding protein n=1 Tax=Mumia flava TaxID=1348852 RepID=A0A2M9ARD8_9ACTN|nr:ATP-binding cassette domain-containing protein [Mumia flava]PJJ48248.1 peptide/nickel transport system ATP-binding protein [Mumia flava]